MGKIALPIGNELAFRQVFPFELAVPFPDGGIAGRAKHPRLTGQPSPWAFLTNPEVAGCCVFTAATLVALEHAH